MAKVTVRVRMFPDPIEVDDSEIPNLRSQGLLVDERQALAARREALAAELARVDAELAKTDAPSTGEQAKPATKPAAKSKES